MAFKRGAAAAQEAEKAAKAARGGGFDKVQYLQLEDGGSAIVRLLHDGDAWYYFLWHGYLPMREPSPEWPEKVREFYLKKTLSATCQRDENIGGDFCFACDVLHEIVPNDKTMKYKRPTDRGRYFPRQRYLIPVVMREEIIATQDMIDSGQVKARVMRGGREVSMLNRVAGVVDKTEEGDLRDPETGEKTGQRGQVPMIRLIEHPYDTSIAGLTAIWQDSEDGTILDRDLKITRQGEKIDTKYLWSARQPVLGMLPSGESRTWDLNDPEVFAVYQPYIPDVEALITERSTEEYYAKFFDPKAPFFAYDSDPTESEGDTKASDKAEPLDEEASNALAKAREEILAGMAKN